MLNALRWVGRFAVNERGNAAVEFAFVAPVLAFACIAVVDIGFAINQRMAADHILRIGADAAMSDPGEAVVQNVLNQTASGHFPSLSTEPLPTTITADTGALHLKAKKFCSCPSSRDVVITCPGTCSGSAPLAFYRLTAAKRHVGMLLPATEFRSALQVQVR